MWASQEGRDPPFTGPQILLRIKQTGREKDWPIVGELARLLPDVRDQLLHSRSARDLLALAMTRPEAVAEVAKQRPALRTRDHGSDEVRLALERERFAAMDADTARIRAYRISRSAASAVAALVGCSGELGAAIRTRQLELIKVLRKVVSKRVDLQAGGRTARQPEGAPATGVQLRTPDDGAINRRTIPTSLNLTHQVDVEPGPRVHPPLDLACRNATSKRQLSPGNPVENRLLQFRGTHVSDVCAAEPRSPLRRSPAPAPS